MVAQHMVNESRRTKPTGSTAYQALLEYYHLDLNFDPARFMAVMETLEKTVEKDPDNGACWISLARLYADMLGHEMMQDRITIERALACARNGVERLPYALKGHLILALILVLDDQMDEALRQVGIAVELNRGSLSYLDAIGYLLILCGDWDRGPIFARRAVTRNPFHRPIGQAGLWLDAVHRADWPEALERARAFNLKYSFWGPLMRIVAMVSLGIRGGIDTEAQQLLAMKPDFPQCALRLVRLYIKGHAEQERIAKALQAVDLIK